MTESNMPTTYETRTTTTTSGTTIGLHPEYLRTIPGILKIVEIVLDIITFICAIASPWWAHFGGGWVQFVSMSAFVTTLILFIFYLTGIYHRLPGPWLLIEFIYYCIFTVFFLIAAIVCAAKAYGVPSIGAAAFFGFAATIVYAVDTFMQFRQIRFVRGSGGGEAAAGTPAQSPSSTEKGGRF